MPTPEEQRKQRLLDYSAAITARALLRKRKSELVIEAARWQRIHHAQIESAEGALKSDRADQAIRDVIIVAVTGVAACVASWAVTSLLARHHGAAYVTGSLGAPAVATTAAVTTETGGVILVTTNTPISLTLTQFIVSQLIQTLLVRLPTGMFLRWSVGGNAMDGIARFYAWVAGEVQGPGFSIESYRELRDALLLESGGSERHRRVLADPSARSDQLAAAITGAIQEKVAQHIGEALFSIKPPANVLLLMSDRERDRWYRNFRTNIDAYLDKNHPDLSRPQKEILSNQLRYEFWRQAINQLNALDQRWHGDIRTLRRLITNEELSMERLMGGGSRR